MSFERIATHLTPVAVALVILAWSATGAGGGADAPPRKETAFSWKASYAEALAAARERRTLLLVYFPPVSPAPDPQVLGVARRALGRSPGVEGVRVGADDVVALLGKLDVKTVPAVLLLDRRENVFLRHEKDIPGNFWVSVKAVVKSRRRNDDALAKTIREARQIAARGDYEAAYRKVARLLTAKSTPPELQAEGRQVEALFVRQVRRDLLAALAREGLSPDSEIRDALEALRDATTHPAMRREIGRELQRLAGGTIGAR